VSIDFAAAPGRDLFRLLADVERRNYVVGPGDLPPIDLVAPRVPAGAVATALVAAIGRTADTSGNLTYVRDASGAALDPAWIKRGGPTLELDVHGARAGEIYAALAALGADVGAPCTDGDPIDVRVRDVKAGAAVAVIAAL